MRTRDIRKIYEYADRLVAGETLTNKEIAGNEQALIDEIKRLADNCKIVLKQLKERI